MVVHKKFNALGRGLDALISTEAVRTQGSSTINEIQIDQIQANPNQPRREFDEESLQELAIVFAKSALFSYHTASDCRQQISDRSRRTALASLTDRWIESHSSLYPYHRR